jgi:hypothetical protein
VICRASHSAVGCRVSPLWDGQHYPAARIGVLPLNSRTMRESSAPAPAGSARDRTGRARGLSYNRVNRRTRLMLLSGVLAQWARLSLEGAWGDSVMQAGHDTDFSRRDLLSLIGTVAGSTAMYHAMSSLGFAGDSAYTGPIELRGDVKDTSVLILGAGLAGMTAALYAKSPGAGLGAAPIAGEPIDLSDILKSQLWRYLQSFAVLELQTTMFQPVGGMDMIGKAFAREVGDLIRYGVEVRRIQQDENSVTVTYVDVKAPAIAHRVKADLCICTIPLSILSQIPIDVDVRMKAAIGAVPYASAVKVGLQFKRRFWEEDEAIYGGISYTDLPIRQIGYPNSDFNRDGQGVLPGGLFS